MQVYDREWRTFLTRERFRRRGKVPDSERQPPLPIFDDAAEIAVDEQSQVAALTGQPMDQAQPGQAILWPELASTPEDAPVCMSNREPGSVPGTVQAGGERVEEGREGKNEKGTEKLAAEQTAASLTQLERGCRTCRRCDLRAGCTQVVFGEGNPHARLMFVGEGPGQQEDVHGRPFVGAAGQLLDRILAAVGIKRDEVYIANVVKCRPPGNRLPTWEEAEACLPHLIAQIQAIRPKIIVCLGALATQALIDRKARITRVRGTWFKRDGIMYMPTFHPAALLRDEMKKRPVWEDMKKVKEALDRLGTP